MRTPNHGEYFVLILKNGYPEIVFSDPNDERQKGLMVNDKHWKLEGEVFEFNQMRFMNGMQNDSVMAVYPKHLSLENVNVLAQHFLACTRSTQI